MKRSPAAAQPRAQREARERRLGGAKLPTGRPRPEWMTDPKKLPKAPPGRRNDDHG
jgi:hypothetical protein